MPEDRIRIGTLDGTTTSSGDFNWTDTIVSGVTDPNTLLSGNQIVRAETNLDVTFPHVDLVFKGDGRILLRGREIHNDLELVNALRQNFGLEGVTQLDRVIRDVSERLADRVDEEIYNKLMEDESEEELYVEI